MSQIIVLAILILINAFFAATEIAFISLNDAKIEKQAKEGNKKAKQIKKNAKVLSDELQRQGIRVISGGTDTHVLLADMKEIGITGKVAQTVLDEIGITANRNTIPFETLSPFVTSGIRLGSPALTTRGLVEEDFKEIAEIISLVVKSPEDTAVKNSCAERVQVLCNKYPIYEDL